MLIIMSLIIMSCDRTHVQRSTLVLAVHSIASVGQAAHVIKKQESVCVEKDLLGHCK